MKKGIWLLLAIILLGAILRCLAIANRGIIYDDAFSIFLAERPLHEIISGTAADTMPPLYYFLLHFWMSLGREIWVLRLLSVLLSLGSIPLLYYLVSRLVNKEAGLWSAFLVAINPISIYHAQDLRMYSLVSFLLLWYVVSFVRISLNISSGNKKILDWVGLAISGTLAMYSHNLAIFGLIIPDIILLCQRRWRLFLRIMGAQVVIGMLFLPWLVLVPGQLQKIQTAFWTPQPGIVDAVNAAMMTVTTLPLPSQILPIALGISLTAIVLSYFLVVKRSFNDKAAILVSFAVFLPLLLFIVSYIMRPVFVPRGFLLAIIIFLGIGGTAISLNKTVLAKGLLAGLFVAGAVISLPYQITYDDFPRSPFKELVTFLSTNAKEEDIILHENKLSYFPSRFYDRDLKQAFLADVPNSPNDTFAPASQEAMQIFPEKNIEETVAGKKRIYFVVFQESLEEYTVNNEVRHPQILWLRDHAHQVDEIIFNDLILFVFEP
jgi:mannosyltransferase